MKTGVWTIQEGIEARKLNDEGLTARQIGARIGRSRNSVIGWFHRQGVALATPKKLEKFIEEKKRRHIKRQPSPPKPITDFKPRLFFNSKTNEPIPQPSENSYVSFMKLSNFMCKAVIGEAKGLETMFCGEKPLKAGHSWCAYHHSIYFGQKRETKDVERKIVSRGDRIFGTFGS